MRLADHARVTCESLAYLISACKSAYGPREYSTKCLQGDFARLELDGETQTRRGSETLRRSGNRVADALARLPSVFVSTYPAAYCYRSPLFVGICKSTRCVNSRTPDAAHRRNVPVSRRSRTISPMSTLIAVNLFHFSCLSFFSSFHLTSIRRSNGCSS